MSIDVAELLIKKTDSTLRMKFNLHTVLEWNAGHEQGNKCRMKEWKADEQERVGECAEDEKLERMNEGIAELNGEWMMEDGRRVMNGERTRKISARRREREPRKEKRNMDGYRKRI